MVQILFDVLRDCDFWQTKTLNLRIAPTHDKAVFGWVQGGGTHSLPWGVQGCNSWKIFKIIHAK
jgi:hypothetical protein